jgi:hypothetical protein
VSDINTAVVDGLKVLDLKRPIREADIRARPLNYRGQRDTPVSLAKGGFGEHRWQDSIGIRLASPS